jgi:AAA15 family ATPase/GTPase
MLIRFVVDNVYSFGEEREFNMLPQPRLRTLDHHKYKVGGLDLLKLGAIYGPNGAGKSNLVKALSMLQEIVLGKTIPYKMEKARFKFRDAKKGDRQLLAVQFIQDGIPMYYGLEVRDRVVSCEELYISGLGKREDRLIFERKLDAEGKTQLRFKNEFEEDPDSVVLKRVILKSLIRSNEAVMSLLAELGSPFLHEVENAINWFENSLTIITPTMRPIKLVQVLGEDEEFKKFGESLLRSFDLGITNISIEEHAYKDGEGFPGDFDHAMQETDQSENKVMFRRTPEMGDVAIRREGDQVFVKKIQLVHGNLPEYSNSFDLGEESDGSNRLLDFIPVMHDLGTSQSVFVIDELERSLHPVLTKEIISKFSKDKSSKGQLIFTTHESNLLDQGILRQDEIWFAEKDERGCTDLYSLSDYKEHNTIDIRKGYLQGRYGAVPFLGNFKDLNWHSNAASK